MKLSIIFVLLLVVFVTHSEAQRCPQRAGNPTCIGPPNAGRGAGGCVARIMWYYNTQTRQCAWFQYRGCGGTDNRWCTRQRCEQMCRR